MERRVVKYINIVAFEQMHAFSTIVVTEIVFNQCTVRIRSCVSAFVFEVVHNDAIAIRRSNIVVAGKHNIDVVVTAVVTDNDVITRKVIYGSCLKKTNAT